MTDAKKVMCKDCEKWCKNCMHVLFRHFPQHLVSESLVEGNAMERNNKKMGSLFQAFSRAGEKLNL